LSKMLNNSARIDWRVLVDGLMPGVRASSADAGEANGDAEGMQPDRKDAVRFVRERFRTGEGE
jgi:hypothetical protein